MRLLMVNASISFSFTETRAHTHTHTHTHSCQTPVTKSQQASPEFESPIDSIEESPLTSLRAPANQRSSDPIGLRDA